MKKLLYVLLVLIAVPALAQTVYRWVDSNGVVHYSDMPHKGAKAVQLGAATVLPFKVPAEATMPGASGKLHTPKAPSYKVKILAPAPGSTIWPVNYKVHVNVGVKPPLQGDAMLRYQLDGKNVGKPTPRTSIELHKVYRGTHTLTVLVVGGKGEIWGKANSIFYARQHSILHPGRPSSHKSGGGGGR